MEEFIRYKMQPVSCPGCKRELDSAAGIHDQQPVPGDITLCVYCQCYLTVTQDMSLRMLTNKEWRELPSETRVSLSMMRNILIKMLQEHPQPPHVDTPRG